ncbi:MAG: DUF47 domain-containing protein [Egibacteraceae bacterium]
MRERLTRFLRDVVGRNTEVFVEMLCEQVDTAVAAATLLCEAAEQGQDPGPVSQRIGELEDAGDKHRAALIAELSQALTTPIDREDLFRLSRSIDDVLDYLRDFADELAMFGIDDPSLLAPPIAALRTGLEGLREAVVALACQPARVGRLARDAKHATAVHHAYQQALLQVLEGPVTTDMLRSRELLRRLDVGGLRLGEAADALADGVLKRG